MKIYEGLVSVHAVERFMERAMDLEPKKHILTIDQMAILSKKIWDTLEETYPNHVHMPDGKFNIKKERLTFVKHNGKIVTVTRFTESEEVDTDLKGGRMRRVRKRPLKKYLAKLHNRKKDYNREDKNKNY